MTVGSLGVYGSNGRIRGSYVYLLICHDAGPDLYIKAGLTDQPTKRLGDIRVSCPITPKYFYTAEVHSRDKAKLLEAELLSAFQEWHHHGEWFKVPRAAKAQFNEQWRLAFAAHHSSSWPLSWSKVRVEPLVELARRRKQFVQMRYTRRGKAYQDFARDLRRL